MTDEIEKDWEVEYDATMDGWWSYRLMVEDVPATINSDETQSWYTIRECYFDRNGKIWACSAEPDHISGESPEEILQMLEWMKDALKYPPVRLNDIPQEGAINPGDILEGADLSTATSLEDIIGKLEERDKES